MFSYFDENGDGSISLTEFTRSLNECNEFLVKRKNKLDQTMKNLANKIRKENIEINEIFKVYAKTSF